MRRNILGNLHVFSLELWMSPNYNMIGVIIHDMMSFWGDSGSGRIFGNPTTQTVSWDWRHLGKIPDHSNPLRHQRSMQQTYDIWYTADTWAHATSSLICKTGTDRNATVFHCITCAPLCVLSTSKVLIEKSGRLNKRECYVFFYWTWKQGINVCLCLYCKCCRRTRWICHEQRCELTPENSDGNFCGKPGAVCQQWHEDESA